MGLLGVISIAISLRVLIPFLWDVKWHQCERQCRYEYGVSSFPEFDNSVTGFRQLFAPEFCNCYKREPSTTFLRGLTGGYSFIGSTTWRSRRDLDLLKLPPTVCASDGNQYSTQEEACGNGTYPIHGGYCGRCSTPQDITTYEETKLTQTKTTTECNLVYLFFGKKAAEECMLRHSGQSTGCVTCWVDDMGCAGAQCTLTCLSVFLRGVPHVIDGKLNDCLACDEQNCGPAFIRCAGANRRRCGITSDIARPAQDHWNRTAC